MRPLLYPYLHPTPYGCLLTATRHICRANQRCHWTTSQWQRGSGGRKRLGNERRQKRGLLSEEKDCLKDRCPRSALRGLHLDTECCHRGTLCLPLWKKSKVSTSNYGRDEGVVLISGVETLPCIYTWHCTLLWEEICISHRSKGGECEYVHYNLDFVCNSRQFANRLWLYSVLGRSFRSGTACFQNMSRDQLVSIKTDNTLLCKSGLALSIEGVF